MPDVYWLWGDAGADKSRMARAVLATNTYCKPPDSKWFDGYDGQEVLILNELRKSTFTYSYLLDMLDRYEFRVEVKGGDVPLLAKVIIITCSKAHATLWAELGGTANENLQQLTRRIRQEMHVSSASLSDKKRMVDTMRQSVLRLRDKSNHDAEDVYGQWDGEAAPETLVPGLDDVDTTEPPPAKKARTLDPELEMHPIAPGLKCRLERLPNRGLRKYRISDDRKLHASPKSSLT